MQSLKQLCVPRQSVFDTQRRLPRPLSSEQVRRLERGIQNAIMEAKTEFEWMLAVRDLACF
jgi:hypothetical protein